MTRKYTVTVNGRNLDLRQMTRDEVIQIKDEATSQLFDIKNQIDIAKRKAYTENVYADPDWFQSVERARRHVGASILKINRWLSQMKETNKQNDKPSKSLASFFKEVAYEILDDKTYLMIVEEALYRKRKHEDQKKRAVLG